MLGNYPPTSSSKQYETNLYYSIWYMNTMNNSIQKCIWNIQSNIYLVFTNLFVLYHNLELNVKSNAHMSVIQSSKKSFKHPYHMDISKRVYPILWYATALNPWCKIVSTFELYKVRSYSFWIHRRYSLLYVIYLSDVATNEYS